MPVLSMISVCPWYVWLCAHALACVSMVCVFFTTGSVSLLLLFIEIGILYNNFFFVLEFCCRTGTNLAALFGSFPSPFPCNAPRTRSRNRYQSRRFLEPLLALYPETFARTCRTGTNLAAFLATCRKWNLWASVRAWWRTGPPCLPSLTASNGSWR